MFFLSQRIANNAKHGPYIAKAFFSKAVEMILYVNGKPTTTYKLEGGKPLNFEQAYALINPIQNILIESTEKGSVLEGYKATRSIYTDDGLVTKVLSAGPGVEWTDTGDVN